MTPRDSLTTAIDIVVAPTDAFARLRESPTWFWAYVVAAVLTMIGTLAIIPALRVSLEASVPAQLAAAPSIAKLPPADQQKAIAQAVALQRSAVSLSWLFPIVFLPFAALVTTVVTLAATKLGGGVATFGQLWALAFNIQVVSALGTVIAAVIVLIRGPAAFGGPDDTGSVLPSLGMFVPGSWRVPAAFLRAINVIDLWQCALLALGLIAIAKLSRAWAWGTAVGILCSIAGLAALGAAAQPHAS